MKSIRGISSFLLLLTIWGCRQTTELDWYSQNIAATFIVDKWTITDTNGSTGSDKQVAVTLWNENNHGPVTGGAVTMNSASIPFSSHSYYQLDQAAGQQVPLPLGSIVSFSVAGSSEFPSLTDSMLFPNSDVNVTLPKAQSTVSMSSDLKISWDYLQNSTDSISVAVMGNAAGNDVIEYNVPDTGGITIPSTAFSTFPLGKISVVVTRYREKYGIDKQRKYWMYFYTAANSCHMLVP